VTAINTKSLSELETAQNEVVRRHNGVLERGIQNGWVDREDGLPWLEVRGTYAGKAEGERFCQDLADALNVRVLFNGITCRSGSEGDVICAVLDFDPLADSDPSVPVPPLERDEDELLGYGGAFAPRA
jgi:hypothetical protein